MQWETAVFCFRVSLFFTVGMPSLAVFFCQLVVDLASFVEGGTQILRYVRSQGTHEFRASGREDPPHPVKCVCAPPIPPGGLLVMVLPVHRDYKGWRRNGSTRCFLLLRFRSHTPHQTFGGTRRDLVPRAISGVCNHLVVSRVL